MLIEGTDISKFCHSNKKHYDETLSSVLMIMFNAFLCDSYSYMRKTNLNALKYHGQFHLTFFQSNNFVSEDLGTK